MSKFMRKDGLGVFFEVITIIGLLAILFVLGSDCIPPM